MEVSPLDLRQHKFRRTVRGFDPVEVSALLAAVADDYEAAVRETDRLRQELAKTEALMAEHRQREADLRNMLLTAQRVSEDIRKNAEEEARRIVREAQTRSDLLLEKTQARLEDIQREIDGLKLKRRSVETTIQSTIQTLQNTLEYVREQEARDGEERTILIHRPRHGDAPPPEPREGADVRRVQALP